MTEPTDYIRGGFKLARFVAQKNNQCGVLYYAVTKRDTTLGGNCKAFSATTFIGGVRIIELKSPV